MSASSSASLLYPHTHARTHKAAKLTPTECTKWEEPRQARGNGPSLPFTHSDGINHRSQMCLWFMMSRAFPSVHIKEAHVGHSPAVLLWLWKMAAASPEVDGLRYVFFPPLKKGGKKSWSLLFTLVKHGSFEAVRPSRWQSAQQVKCHRLHGSTAGWIWLASEKWWLEVGFGEVFTRWFHTVTSHNLFVIEKIVAAAATKPLWKKLFILVSLSYTCQVWGTKSHTSQSNRFLFYCPIVFLIVHFPFGNIHFYFCFD